MPELLFLFLGVVMLLGVGESARRGALGRRMERSMDAMRETPPAVQPRTRAVPSHRRRTAEPAVSPQVRRAS